MCGLVSTFPSSFKKKKKGLKEGMSEEEKDFPKSKKIRVVAYEDALKELTNEKTPYPTDELRCYRCDGDRSPRVVKKKAILSMAKMQFDMSGEYADLHSRILFTIYARLMDDDRVPELRGSHWTSLGFQTINLGRI